MQTMAPSIELLCLSMPCDAVLVSGTVALQLCLLYQDCLGLFFSVLTTFTFQLFSLFL